jgi:hypothetical protein
MIRHILKGVIAGWVVKKVSDHYRRRQARG